MKKIFCLMICFCILLLSASCSVVSENEITSSNSDDVFLTELNSDRDDEYTDLLISDFAGTDNGENQSRDSFNLYKQYFYQNYDENDIVYLIDLTHDNIDDMLVFTYIDKTAFLNPEIHLFTASSGYVKEIYSRGLHNFRTKIMLTSSEGNCNMVVFENGLFQGLGGLSSSEIYFSESGDITEVRKIVQEIVDGDDVDEKNGQFDSEITSLYGSGFSGIYLFPTGYNDEHDLMLDTNPLIVFNGKPDWADEEKTTEKKDLFGTWYCDLDVDGGMLTLIITFSEDGSVEYKYGLKNSELIDSYSGLWKKWNDDIVLDMTGRSWYEEEPEIVETYEFYGIYHATIQNNNLILEHIEGKLLFDDLVNNADNKIFVFRPEELYN